MKKYTFEILRLEDRKKWTSLVDQSADPDFHFLPNFMELFTEKLNGSANIIYFKNLENDSYLLFPFFKRKISNSKTIKISHEVYDIISPWYFGGFLFSDVNPDKNLLTDFIYQLKIYAKENNIVSAFIRLFPFTNSHLKLPVDEINYHYDISYIDLKKPLKEIFSNFKKSNRNSITNALKHNIKIEFSNNETYLKNFITLYKNTMLRLTSNSFYNFDELFFKKLFFEFKNNIFLGVAKYENKIISSSIFIYKYDYAYYWLSGYDYSLKHLNANNLLLFESIKKLKTTKTSKLILGGGSTNLQKFKNSFSKSCISYNTWQKIFLLELYEKLSSDVTSNLNISDNFFPLYRKTLP